ncbi:uridine kinase [Bacillus sp. JCM 19046]|nr:uridine kinase [Bacillus sp. JCM 19046]
MLELAREIEQAFLSQSSKRPYLVALDGLGGAGKTTLVKQFVEYARDRQHAYMIHIDDYIEQRQERYQTGYEPWYEYYQLQWDVDKLKRQLFKPLREGITQVELDSYEKQTDSHRKTTLNIKQKSIVFIEGIFLQREEWRSFYDYIVFLDCPRQTRYERISTREGLEQDNQTRLLTYQTRYWPGEEHYLTTMKPLDRATKVYCTDNG